jgi:AraC-like DNA-binding protein
MAKFIVRKVRVLSASKTKSAAQHLNNNKKKIVISIRKAIKQMIYFPERLSHSNFSVYISNKLNYDYTYLSNIFCSETGITIQQFVIGLKIERVKQLLFTNEFSLTEIASMLHYSSVSHLSNQFRKIAGVSASLYKRSQNKE